MNQEWNPSFVWAQVNLNKVVKHAMGPNPHQVVIGVTSHEVCNLKFTCTGTRLWFHCGVTSHPCGLGLKPSDVWHTYIVSMHLGPTPNQWNPTQNQIKWCWRNLAILCLFLDVYLYVILNGRHTLFDTHMYASLRTHKQQQEGICF